MTLSNDGKCSVQHLTFTSITHLLHHFTHHPIPLETVGLDNVVLKYFVVCQEGFIDHNGDIKNSDSVSLINVANGAVIDKNIDISINGDNDVRNNSRMIASQSASGHEIISISPSHQQTLNGVSNQNGPESNPPINLSSCSKGAENVYSFV